MNGSQSVVHCTVHISPDDLPEFPSAALALLFSRLADENSFYAI